MSRFFLTGLPRSGTTWCANFFTQGSVFCFHEALLGCESLEALKLKMSLPAKQAETVGDSDSGLIFQVGALRRLLPESPLVVIDRNPFHVMQSLDALGHMPTTSHAHAMMEAHQRALRMADVVVPFEALFLEATLRELWDKIAPNEPFSTHRWEMLTKIKVEPELSKYLPWYAENLSHTLKPEAA